MKNHEEKVKRKLWRTPQPSFCFFRTQKQKSHYTARRGRERIPSLAPPSLTLLLVK